MNKTLVYHLYISDDFDTNIMYNVHKECLKYYKDIFNKAKFIVALNDLNSESSKEKSLNFINYIGFNCEVDISFRKNNELYETDTIKREIIDVNNQNGDFIFFSHIKGVNNFKNIDNISITFESIFRWVLVMYFYNLNYVKEVEDIFLGKNFSPEIMYGTLLLVDNNNEKRLFITKYHFSGTFYWFNNQFYNGIIYFRRVKKHAFFVIINYLLVNN